MSIRGKNLIYRPPEPLTEDIRSLPFVETGIIRETEKECLNI